MQFKIRRNENPKPYIIAAMILLAKFADPAKLLEKLEEKGTARVFESDK